MKVRERMLFVFSGLAKKYYRYDIIKYAKFTTENSALPSINNCLNQYDNFLIKKYHSFLEFRKQRFSKVREREGMKVVSVVSNIIKAV
jgi:hypothetical protein